nr:ABC transporter substrate-binding protein [uncultured Blautia sp.]
MKNKTKKIGVTLLTAAMMTTLAATSVNADNKDSKEWEYKEAELSLLTFPDINSDGLNAVCELAEEKLGIKVDIEVVTAGEDIVSTREASGDLNDLVIANSGATLGTQLHPEDNFIPLSDNEYIMSRLDDTFASAVTNNDIVYGIPQSTAMAGCILYNKQVFEDAGAEVPDTWDDFLEVCQKIKENGKTPLIGTFGDTWTSQVLFLGDYYNLRAEEPDFASKFEAGEEKYATSTAALKSFSKYADVKDFYNEDCFAATFSDGVDYLAEGDGAMWPILTEALPELASLYGEDYANNIGAFGIPGDDAENHGLTVWEPNAIYGNKNSDKVDDITRFMEFYVSDEALDAFNSAQTPQGPVCIKGYEPSVEVFPAVEDMQAYIDAGKTSVALEFECSVIGANCDAICSECASGQTTAEEAAKKLDEDCYKAAVQLGLDWKK